MAVPSTTVLLRLIQYPPKNSLFSMTKVQQRRNMTTPPLGSSRIRARWMKPTHRARSSSCGGKQKRRRSLLKYSEIATYELRLARASLLLEAAVRLLHPLPHLFHLALLRLFRLGVHLLLLPALLSPLSLSARRLTPLFLVLVLFLVLFSTATAAVANTSSFSVSLGGGLPRPRLGLPLVLETPRLGNLGEVWGRVRDVSESVLGNGRRGRVGLALTPPGASVFFVTFQQEQWRRVLSMAAAGYERNKSCQGSCFEILNKD